MLSRHAAELALGAALSTGGDFSEIFWEDTRTNNLQLLDGKIDTATTCRSHGAGLRVFKGLSSVYVYTNDTSADGLLRAADQAAAAIGSSRAQAGDVRLMGSRAANAHPIEELPGYVDGARKAKLLRDAGAAARAADACIKQVQATLRDVDSDIAVYNSEGLFISDRRTYTRIAVMAVAAGEGESQVGYEGPGAMMGYELFRTRVDVEQVARQAAQTAALMLRAQQCPAGVMPVAIEGGFGGVIFHEACGHSLEAAAVALGNSEFCGKLGQRIASDAVTAIDDGTLPGEWGSINIDDEGTPSGRLVLIEKGILKNYMIDRLNARRMNMPVTGSGRRQSYQFAPTSRMRNTYIAPGESTDEEIISTMGDGLYARRMGGGSVNPATGEFNFSVSEGYLVRDGKIDRPVRGATLIGKGGQVLMKIDKVGRNLAMAQGMCGASSGSIPVNVGQPMIRVSEMTVGGR